MNIKSFVTVLETSRITGRSEGAIRRRLQEKKLPYIKIGFSVLIPKEEVQKLKKEKEVDQCVMR